MSIEAMKLALEALERYDDEWLEDGRRIYVDDEISALRTAIEQAQEQEPVAWMHDSHVGFNVPLYTAPPQREWVGLTDEEAKKVLYDIKVKTMGVITTEDIVRAIEAKLKEKNAA